MKIDGTLWTLGELTDAVAAALAKGYGGTASGRVRDVPDRRTIRYYTTLGLIDRPADMRGRTALYRRRHLLQLVAIKQLQALGRSLAEIQQELAGQTDRELARIAGPEAQGIAETVGEPSTAGSSRDFWKQEPRVSTAADAGRGDPTASPGPAVDLLSDDRPQPMYAVPLREGVTLLLASSRPVNSDDLQAIRSAAAPLIRTLTRHHLIDPLEGGETP